MELNHQPAAISMTMVMAVIHITARVLRSALSLLTWNWWSWDQWARLSVCMVPSCCESAEIATQYVDQFLSPLTAFGITRDGWVCDVCADMLFQHADH